LHWKFDFGRVDDWLVGVTCKKKPLEVQLYRFGSGDWYELWILENADIPVP
jgi:hypothetical protein